MSMFEQEYEYQPRDWVGIPKSPRSTAQWLAAVGGAGKPGVVEIKPQTKRGLSKGREQLGTYVGTLTKHQPWLVTYVGLGPDLKPMRTGRAGKARVFATHYKTGTQYVLGDVDLPATIRFPRVDQPGFFGSAVEPIIRGHLNAMLRKNGKIITPATGGAVAGADLVWSEIAEMYSELAQELRDPFLAELAHELAAA